MIKQKDEAVEERGDGREEAAKGARSGRSASGGGDGGERSVDPSLRQRLALSAA